MAGLKAAAAARRERIVELLAEEERSAKCLAVMLDVSQSMVRDDLTTLMVAERVERTDRNAYDWPGTTGTGKSSRVWRLWTGNGAPPEGASLDEKGADGDVVERGDGAGPGEDPAPEDAAVGPDGPDAGPGDPDGGDAEPGAADDAPGEVAAPVGSGHVLSEPHARYFAYLDALLARAKTRSCPEEVYERIDRMMQDGPPA